MFSTPLYTIVFGLGIVLIFSDLPLFRGNALFESTRCSRSVWVSGRVLYIVGIAVFYTFVMAVLCILTSHGAINDTEKWGKLLNTMANITGRYTPIQAFGLSFLMSALCATFLGLLMLLLSMSFGRTAALMGGSILSVLDFVIYWKLPYEAYHISPLSLTRLNIICVPDMPYYPTLQYAMTALIGSSILVSTLCIAVSHMNKSFADKILRNQY